MTVLRFHQFVALEKGPVNTAVIDFLQKSVYHVSNDCIEKFLSGDHETIGEFLDFALDEQLVFAIDEDDWLPPLNLEPEDDEVKNKLAFQLEIQDGADLELVCTIFTGYPVTSVLFTGPEIPERLNVFKDITLRDGSFDYCSGLASVTGEFTEVDEESYVFNKKYNSCWGKKIAVSRDNKARPCIHSNIVLGDLTTDDIHGIIEKAQTYWYLTKDKIEKCNVCEFRYLCYDCREAALRESGSLTAQPPSCKYNPATGIWE